MPVERPEALAGAFRVTTRSVLVPYMPATQQVVGFDPTRVALFVTNQSDGTIFIWPSSTIPTGGGLPVPPNGFLSFYFARDGGLVGMEWYGSDRTYTAGTYISVIEVAYRPRSE
jgi:hypothetical protein